MQSSSKVTWRLALNDSFVFMYQLKLFKKAYVVVNFLPQVSSVFLLFLGMVMYVNEVKTKEK